MSTRDAAIHQKRLGLLALIDTRMGREDGRRVAECHGMLLRIVGNILESPGEMKYRQIKMKSNVFATKVLKVDGALDYLLLAGFTKKVIEFEEYIVIDDTTDESVANALASLQIAHDVLQERAKKIEERKQLAIKTEEAAKREEEERLRKVRLAIEDDRKGREMRQVKGNHTPATTDWPQPK